MWAVDDVGGSALDPTDVMKARAEEIKYYQEMGVYKEVTRQEATGAYIDRQGEGETGDDDVAWTESTLRQT